MERGGGILAAVLLTGCCLSNTFGGDNGEISFGSDSFEFCTWSPPTPVAMGSSLSLEPAVEAETPEESFTITTDDAGIADVRSHDAVSHSLDAIAVGTTTIRAVSSTGRTDQFDIEVARPVAARLIDPLTYMIEGSWSDDGWPIHLSEVWTHPVMPVVIAADAPILFLRLHLLDDADRRLMWTADAIDIEGLSAVLVEPPGYFDLALPVSEGSRSLIVRDRTGETLLEGTVRVEAAPSFAELELDVLVSPAEENGEDAGGTSLSTDSTVILRALVRDTDGNVVWQPPVGWLVVGDGEGMILGEEGEDSWWRTDIYGFYLFPENAPNLPDFHSCITASVPGEDGSIIAKSVVLTPDGAIIFDGEACRVGCACQGMGASHAPAGILLPVLVGFALRRRRRD